MHRRWIKTISLYSKNSLYNAYLQCRCRKISRDICTPSRIHQGVGIRGCTGSGTDQWMSSWSQKYRLLPRFEQIKCHDSWLFYFQSLKTYKVVIIYKAVGQQTNLLGANHPLGYPGEAGRILAVCCGPSEEKECPVGARTTGPCAHAVAAIMASCVLPTNQVKHNLTGHYGCWIISISFPAWIHNNPPRH